MPECTICAHPQRAEIDGALASATVAKRRLASRYGLVETSIRRHERRHLDPRLIEAHKASLEAQDASHVRTARQNCLEILADLRSCREAFVVGDRIIPHQDFLQILDRAIKANEQYARITKEIGAEPLTAFLIELGVRSQDEAKNRLALSRTGENLSPQETVEVAVEALELAFRLEPGLRAGIMSRLNRASYAEVLTNGVNGHDGNA